MKYRIQCWFSSSLLVSRKNCLPTAWCIALTIVELLLSLPLCAQQRGYTVTRLDFTVPYTLTHTLNDRGHITGYYSPWEHAILWTPQHGMQDLGTLGGRFSFGAAVNNLDEVVGDSDTATGERHAFLWRKGHMIDLGAFGGTSSFASDINDRGQVIGSYATADGNIHGFVWQNGVMHNLDAPTGGWSYPTAINFWGTITGYGNINQSSLNGQGIHALVYTPWTGMVDIGTVAGGAYCFANAINNWGVVTGGGYDANFNGMHAFLWTLPTGLQQLHTIDGYGNDEGSGVAINDWGDVLVWTNTTELYSHGILYNLDTLVPAGTPSLDVPISLNNRGQILAQSYSVGIMLLTPR